MTVIVNGVFSIPSSGQNLKNTLALQIVQITEIKFGKVWAKISGSLCQCCLIIVKLSAEWEVLIKSRVNLAKIMVDIKTWKVVLSVQLSDLDVYAAWIYDTIPNILFPIAPFVWSKSGNFCGDFLYFPSFLCPMFMQGIRPPQKIRNKNHQKASNFRSISRMPSLQSFSMWLSQTCFSASSLLERFSTCSGEATLRQ